MQKLFEFDEHLGAWRVLVQTRDISNRAVTSDKIALQAILTELIADLAVTTAKLADLSVTTPKIAELAVVTSKLADLAVTTAKVAEQAITTEKIHDLAVITQKIADLAVTTGKIADLAVTEPKMHDNSVSTRTIQEKAVTEPKLGDESVSTRTLQPESVTHDKLHNDAVEGNNIKDKNIAWQKLNDDLQNIIASAGQHGVSLSNEWGDSTLIGLTQKMLSEALGNVHKDGDNFVSLQYQIDQIVSGGATVNLTASPTTVFVGVQSNITLNATTNAQASSIKIFKNGVASPIATGSGTSKSYTDAITPAARGNTQYYAEFVISGLAKRYPTSGFVNVQAVDKIYTGAGATYGDTTMVEETSPHAAGTFNKQITTADGDYLFIEVPDNFNLTAIKLVSTYETSLGFTQIESARTGYKAYKNNDARGAGSYTYKFTITNA